VWRTTAIRADGSAVTRPPRGPPPAAVEITIADRHVASVPPGDRYVQDRLALAFITTDNRSVELRQLRSFLAVARLRHFTRAGQELRIAQPALSQQIRRLEAELGIELLSRTSRRVRLTEAGEVLAVRAQRALAELDSAVAELGELSGLVRGRLTIGALPAIGPLDPPAVLAGFHAEHPGVDLRLREETADEVLALLRSDELDLAISFVDPEGGAADLGRVTLFEEELVLVTAAGHPLAARRAVSSSDLATEALIVTTPGSAIRRTIEQALAAAGVSPRIAFESNELATLLGLAERGMGVAVLPRTWAAGRHGGRTGRGVATVSLAPAPLVRPVALVWRRGRRQSPAGAAFVRHLGATLGLDPARLDALALARVSVTR
jgi:DNA-binding transcriptional LysR family regulator